MREKADTSIRCIICGGPSRLHKRVLNWGQMRRCLECHCIFSVCETKNTIRNDIYFDQAYRGNIPGEMRHFNRRIRMRRYIREFGSAYPCPGGTAWENSIRTLKYRLPKGSNVLDIGCGLGYFLDRLEKEGFSPLGLDIADFVVDMLRKEGRQVWSGSLATYPHDWPQPAACTMHFVLHHVDDPIGFLSGIRKRFPTSPLVLTDVGTSNRVSPDLVPPRHLTIWTRKSMDIALRKAGYDAKVFELPVPPTYGESVLQAVFLSLPSSLHRVSILRLIVAGRRPILWAVAPLMRALGRDTDIGAIARPLA